jgi:hypothetical protein
MDKPVALTDRELAHCRERLKNHWPWTPHTHATIASLVAMAEERNALIREKDDERAKQAILGAMM